MKRQSKRQDAKERRMLRRIHAWNTKYGTMHTIARHVPYLKALRIVRDRRSKLIIGDRTLFMPSTNGDGYSVFRLEKPVERDIRALLRLDLRKLKRVG